MRKLCHMYIVNILNKGEIDFMSRQKNISKLEIGATGKWTGIIKNILYVGQNDYCIAQIEIGSDTITALGKISMPQKKAVIKIEGQIVENPERGEKQIKIKKAEIKTSKESFTAMMFLTNAVSGVGIKTAADIVAVLGEDVNAYVDKLDKAIKNKQITKNRAQNIKKGCEENIHLYPIFEVLKGNVTFNQAKKIYEEYKESAKDIIKQNPYRLIYDIDKFGFITVDNIALKSGIKYDSDKRLSAALLYCVNKAETDDGSTYISKSQLLENCTELVLSVKELETVYYQDVIGINIIPDDTSEWEDLRLAELIKNGPRRLNNILNNWNNELKRDKDIEKEKFTSDEIDTLDCFYSKKQKIDITLERLLSEMSTNLSNVDTADLLSELDAPINVGKSLVIQKGEKGEVAVYRSITFKKECRVAKTIVTMYKNGGAREISDADADMVVKEIEALNNFNLDKIQIEAAKKAVNERVSIISGGPGNGKTTIIMTAIKMWKKSHTKEKASKKEELRVALLAPTGKAAKRMTEATGHKAMTIHRFLASTSEVINKNTLFFVDESSMIDMSLFYKLVACIENAQLCIVGDVDQLPSIGAGRVLEDLIKSSVIPFTMLDVCHRNMGTIHDNSKIIKDGRLIQSLRTDNHFKTLWLPNPVVTLETIMKIYLANVDKYGVNNMIVLTPMIKSATGVSALNKKIQKAVNPPNANKPAIELKGGEILRVGDRIIQTKNNYDQEAVKDGKYISGVFNGDTGCVKDIDTFNGTVTVLFDDGKISTYKSSDADQLQLAYAMSYHKSQGSEYRFVICALTTADFVLLQRKILYTGATRGKDFVAFVGMAKAFQIAINNTNGDDRHTTLKNRIKEYAKIA